MYLAEAAASVTPGKSGLPSSRFVGNSGEAMRLTRIVSRKRQRIVHDVRDSQPSARVQRVGVRCAADVLAFGQVAGG